MWFLLRKAGIFLLCFVFLLFPPVDDACAREKPVVRDIAVINSERDLLLYFQVNNSFIPEMEEGVKNGIPVAFSFHIILYKKRSGWFDKEMASYRLERSLDYDNLKDVYRIRMSGKGNRTVTRSKFENARKLMEEVNDFELIELAKLRPGGRYSIRIKVSLERKTLPSNFQNIIPFWNLWEFETEWAELNFFIPASSKIEIAPDEKAP